MSSTTGRPGWTTLSHRWEEQQESFFPQREWRFRAMLDLLEEELGPRFRALDLGSGPGSFGARILRRFATARTTAVEYDPVVLRVGQGALGSMGGRFEWIQAKLSESGWADTLPRERYDAAASTTALHWLPPSELTRLYGDLARLVRRGGVFLNGDHLQWGAGEPQLAGLGSKILQICFPQRCPSKKRTAWRRWWDDAWRVAALEPALLEHNHLYGRRWTSRPPRADLSLYLHVRKLKAACFRLVTTVWQDFENRVLFAKR